MPEPSADSRRDELQDLREQIARIEASFKTQLAAAEARLADQRERLNALGRGREETMLMLGETRAELARVRRERDQLHKRLASVENMQTATLALADRDEEEPEAVIHALPSVDELMASLQTFPGGGEAEAGPTAPPDAAQPEMISPEVVFPEEYGEQLPSPAGARRKNAKVLVFVDADPPIKYPLFNDVTTIGRSETADIRVDGDYISRVHARIVLTRNGAVVEDVASKNGIKVNFKPAERHALRHGDILSLGKLHFTFIDTSADGAD